MKTINHLLSFIRLDRNIRYHHDYASLLDLMNQLSTDKLNLGIVCTKISDSEYILEPDENIPLEMSGPFFKFDQDCTLELKLIKKAPTLQVIHCTGKIRRVHFGLIGFFTTFLVFQYGFTEDGLSWGGLLTALIFWPLTHFLLNFYWSQKEKYVIDQFKKAMIVLMKVNRK